MKGKADESIERLLRGAPKGPAGANLSRECLDAETLAAWTDGGLSGDDHATAEAHLSACPRCQAMLAIVVRTAPPRAIPEAIPGWWGQRIRGWRWLVPMTAGTAAIVLWFAVQNSLRPPVVQQPAAPNLERTEEAQQERAQSQVAPVAPRESDARANASAERRLAERQDPRDENAPAQTAAAADRLGRVAEAAPSAAPQVAAAPSSTAPQALESSAARASNEAAALSRQDGTGTTSILSPNPSIRWGIGPAGSIRYSTNSGSTWEALTSGVSADLIAGVSPSTTVCWVVGRSGAVLLTIDGRRFQRLPFPESVDLTAVRATDARAATVMTADKRAFRTTDGGQTWAQTPLQEF